jgi:pimeloyl-ACP methyl ester carboxylesterase
MTRILFLLVLILSTPFIIFCESAKINDNIAISEDGSRIKFDSSGKGKTAIIFIHGWGGNKYYWEPQLIQFSSQYKVVAIDLAGFGESDNKRTNWTMLNFGKDVSAVIDKLKLKKVILVGHSMGGAAVIESAKLSSNKIIGIVLVDIFKNIEVTYSEEEIAASNQALMAIASDPSVDKYKPLFLNNIEELSKRTYKLFENVKKVGWLESSDNFWRWSNNELKPSLAVLKCPVISINSDNPPTNIEAFRKIVPKFEVKIVENVGHQVFWEAPEKAGQYLEECVLEFTKR